MERSVIAQGRFGGDMSLFRRMNCECLESVAFSWSNAGNIAVNDTAELARDMDLLRLRYGICDI